MFWHCLSWMKIFIHVSEFVYTILQHGYAPLCRDFEDFYTRRLYHRIQVIYYLHLLTLIGW